MSQGRLLEKLASLAMASAQTGAPLDLQRLQSELVDELAQHRPRSGCVDVHRFLKSPPAPGVRTPSRLAEHALGCTLCTLRMALDLPGDAALEDFDLVRELARDLEPLVEDLVARLDQPGDG